MGWPKQPRTPEEADRVAYQLAESLTERIRRLEGYLTSSDQETVRHIEGLEEELRSTRASAQEMRNQLLQENRDLRADRRRLRERNAAVEESRDRMARDLATERSGVAMERARADHAVAISAEAFVIYLEGAGYLLEAGDLGRLSPRGALDLWLQVRGG